MVCYDIPTIPTLILMVNHFRGTGSTLTIL